MKQPPKRGRGRPPISGEAGQRFQVTIPPTLAKKLRKLGGGSLSGGISSDPRVAHMEQLKRIILSNQKQIEMFESGKMTVGYGPELGTEQTARAEAARLREQNMQLSVLVRREEAWQRRQRAFYAMQRQFLPHGNGQPTLASIAEFDAAEKALKAVQAEAERIVREIRANAPTAESKQRKE